MSCRGCGSDGTLVGARADLSLYRCRACQLVWGAPADALTPEEHYAHYYRSPQPPAPKARYEEWLRRAEAATGVGRLLEVGAGSGGFVKAALARGWHADAIEISKSALPSLRETGATVFEGDVAKAAYPDQAFDLVVAIEVVEHVPAPGRLLAELFRITRRGGLLLLTTPNFGGVSRRMFGLRWRAIEPEHLSYFTGRTLARLLRDAGYAEASVRSRTLDVGMWRRQLASSGPVAGFDAHGTARLRDSVESSFALRNLKHGLNLVLGVTGLGDSLVAWARR